MAPSTREAVESPLDQGADEKRSYVFDFAGLGFATPVAPVVCQVWDVTDSSSWQDVTATALPGGTGGTIAGSLVTTGLVQALTAGRVYRLECRADDAGGERAEGYVIIYGTR